MCRSWVAYLRLTSLPTYLSHLLPTYRQPLMNVLVGVSGTPRDDLPVSSLPTGRSRLRVRGQLHRRGGEQTWDEAKRHWIRPSVGTLSPQVVVGLCLLRDLFPSSHLARNTISERNLLTCWCRPRKEDPVMLQVTLLILSVH